jgi:hypothetical protein
MAATSFDGENEEVDDDAPLLGILCSSEERRGLDTKRCQKESSSDVVSSYVDG